MTSDNTDITNKSLYRFSDLVDVPTFARMLESFFRATGIPNRVHDASGEQLSLSAGENACTRFHRANPQSAECCRESNLAIMHKLRDGCVAGGMCRNGLVDYASPVVVEGQQLATLFLGQILHTPPNLDFFRAQAARFGFDESDYLDAIKAVPVIDKTRLQDHMEVMVEMAKMLAESGLARRRQAALEHEITTHVQREIQLEDILNFSPVAIGWSEGEARIEYVNRQFTQLFGYTLDDLPDLETWYRRAYPDENFRERVVRPWQEAVALARQNNTQPPKLEADITCKDGSVRRVDIHVAWIGIRRMVSFTNITERVRFEIQLARRERELRTLVENLPDNIARYTTDARHTYVSPSLERVFGQPKENFLGKTPTQCSSDKYSAEAERRIRAVATSGISDEMELEFIVPESGGEIRRHLLRLVAERDEFNHVDGVLGIGSDITERKRLENTLRTNEAQSSAHSRLLQAVLESSPGVIVFALDQDYRYLAFNEKHRATMHAIWGKEIAVGMNMLDVIGNHPDREKAKFGFDRALSGEAFVAEDAYGDKGILRMFWQNFFAPIRDEDGSAIGLTCFVLNITERRQLELRISARDAMLEMVSRGDELAKILNAIVLQVESEDNTMLCSVLLLDKEGTHLLNGAAPNLPVFYNQAIHGIEIGEGVGSCGTAAALGQRVIVEDIQTHAYWQPYAELAHQAGLRSCWSEPIHSSHGKVLGTFAIYHAEPKSPQPEDIERIAFAANLTAIAIESRYAHDELEQRAYTDYLTGLANRRYFLEQAENELARTLRYGRELSILMLDVDRFKQVNDTYGHKVGDLVLQKLSEVFRTTLRDVDIIGRVGGEEFALLLPETGVEQAMQAAERLRTAIASAHVTLDGGLPLRFTASFGVTNLREKDVNIDVLLNQADQALYRAKNGGRNRVCMYLVDEADQ